MSVQRVSNKGGKSHAAGVTAPIEGCFPAPDEH